MKDLLLLAVVLLICTVTSQKSLKTITDVRNCHCNKEFEPLGDPENGYQCKGKTLKIIVPCNLILRPKCACTDATGILTDHEGTWCTRYSGGREIKRWTCENGGDWENFYAQHPTGVPKRSCCGRVSSQSEYLVKMIKFSLFVFLPIALILAEDLSDCKCKDGYSAHKDTYGNMYCRGNVVKSGKSILPCNIIFKPDCVCSNEATSVVQDSSGTWCGRFIDSKEYRRWECENKEDWEAFYQKHPEEKPKS
ncbi:unnamed protein product [Phyllotreta striolata]|uniref:Uncharacterized protein n=1 Tax=Phyllotreta striolata TaxID=444603 RepID=A0A9N9TEK4_PHYSR|nr:unnamed protein product [Phyllotreta striolata]